MATGWHLTRRFWSSLRPGPPSATDEEWALQHLNPGQQLIWARLTNPDRRHAVGVGRSVAAALDLRPGSEVVTAALMHDCGKLVSQLRTPARVVATLVWSALDDGLAVDWLESRWSLLRRLAQYRCHPQLGGLLLAAAGSAPTVVAWASEHHLKPESWTLPPEIATVLKACDDD